MPHPVKQSGPNIIAPEDPDLDETIEVEVTQVFDGDGFLGRFWHPIQSAWVERVPFRLAFIDAPEREQRFGQEAKDQLDQLIGGKKIRIAPIVKLSNPRSPLDDFRRFLCMAFLTEELALGETYYFLDGTCHRGTARRTRMVTRNVELEMVVNGWAWVLRQYPFEYEETYFQAEQDAKREKRGLWADGKPETPWAFKARLKRLKAKRRGQSDFFD